MASLLQLTVSADKLDGAGSVVAVQGELDIATVGEVEQEARRQLELHGSRLVLDLAKTTFMSSSGLNLIARLRHRTIEQGGALVVIAATHRVRRLLEIVPPPPGVRLVETRQEALACLEAGESRGPRSKEAA